MGTKVLYMIIINSAHHQPDRHTNKHFLFISAEQSTAVSGGNQVRINDLNKGFGKIFIFNF